MTDYARLCIALALGIAIQFCAGCGGGRVEPLPSMGDLNFYKVAPKALPDPGSQGAQLVVRYCGQCHDIPDPTTHTADRWVPSVAEMVRYMSLPGGRKAMRRPGSPSSGEADQILAYLQAHAHQGLDMEAYKAALASEEGQAFRETCSQCHRLPDPRQHTANEWPWVVRRMGMNMRHKGIQPPNDTTTARIVGFLQKYAAR